MASDQNQFKINSKINLKINLILIFFLGVVFYQFIKKNFTRRNGFAHVFVYDSFTDAFMGFWPSRRRKIGCCKRRPAHSCCASATPFWAAWPLHGSAKTMKAVRSLYSLPRVSFRTFLLLLLAFQRFAKYYPSSRTPVKTFRFGAAPTASAIWPRILQFLYPDIPRESGRVLFSSLLCFFWRQWNVFFNSWYFFQAFSKYYTSTGTSSLFHPILFLQSLNFSVHFFEQFQFQFHFSFQFHFHFSSLFRKVFSNVVDFIFSFERVTCLVLCLCVCVIPVHSRRQIGDGAERLRGFGPAHHDSRVWVMDSLLGEGRGKISPGFVFFGEECPCIFCSIDRFAASGRSRSVTPFSVQSPHSPSGESVHDPRSVMSQQSEMNPA